jgi:hypothetical protein
MIQGKRAKALSTAATRLLEQPTRFVGVTGAEQSAALLSSGLCAIEGSTGKPYTWSELHNFGHHSMLIITGQLRLMAARAIPPATSRADQT